MYKQQKGESFYPWLRSLIGSLSEQKSDAVRNHTLRPVVVHSSQTAVCDYVTVSRYGDVMSVTGRPILLHSPPSG